jgi:hypothetical protein
MSVKFYDQTQTPAALYKPTGTLTLTYDITTPAGVKGAVLTASSSWNASASSLDSTATDSTGLPGIWTYRGVAVGGTGPAASADNQLYAEDTNVK